MPERQESEKLIKNNIWLEVTAIDSIIFSNADDQTGRGLLVMLISQIENGNKQSSLTHKTTSNAEIQEYQNVLIIKKVYIKKGYVET